MPIVVPKPNSTSFRDGEFELPICLLVGFVALLLVIASNIALTAQHSNLLCHKPNPCPLCFLLSPFFFLLLSHTPLCVYQPPFHSSSLPFYNLPLVVTQMITSPPYPTWPTLLPRIPRKLAHSEDSFETCSKCQTTFGNGFPQVTNSVQFSTPYLTIEFSVVLSPFVDIGPNLVQQLQVTPEYRSYVHILRLLG